jgi:quercetin dioxygenase-like cupin family protein
MHVTTLNAGLPSHAPHKHAQEEIILLIRGNATMTVENKEYPMSPGDFVFAASGDFHGIRNTGKEQCEYFAFQWK